MDEFEKMLSEMLNHKSETQLEDELRQTEDTRYITGIAERNGYSLSF